MSFSLLKIAFRASKVVCDSLILSFFYLVL
nr:MAG TPA: hypothetical protein [Caudoviricetes sp.]